MYHLIASTYGWTFDEIDGLSVRKFSAILRMISQNPESELAPPPTYRPSRSTKGINNAKAMSKIPVSIATAKAKDSNLKTTKPVFSSRGNRIISAVVKKTGRRLI